MTLVLLGQSSSAAQGTNPAIARRIVASAAAALLLAGVAGTAYADTATDSTDANVEVLGDITLTALTPSFLLSGLPGAVVTNAAAVSMNVETNNIAGYSVSVLAADDELVPADRLVNPDEIAIGDLTVEGPATTGYEPVSDQTTTTVATKATRSAEGGDTIVNGYSMEIPFVNADTYSVTLNYVATTL